MTVADSNYKSGFIMLAGAPNVGKSTLLNTLIGQKISITSQKAQTTRNRILGVLHRPAFQMIFVDTPGIHPAKGELNTRLVAVALSALSDADGILFMTDIRRQDAEAEALLVERLKYQNRPVILALNKCDLVRKSHILEAIDRWKTVLPFAAIVPISAEQGTQVEVLVEELAKILPKGPPFFPEDALTDLPERFIAAEIIREKVFRLTGQEIPYSTAVTVDSFKEEDGLVRIHATIHVERESQKGILIGKGGLKLKQIGEAGRKDIEHLLAEKVFLRLFVRVQKNWSKDTRALRTFGY